jgi:hypothetical protein
MYAIYKNSVDITDYVERKSLNIDESLNNQRNTASFSLVSDISVIEGQKIQIYKYSTALSVWVNFVVLEDLFDFEKRFYIWQTVFIWIWETLSKNIISWIDTNLKKITFQNNLWSYTAWVKIWSLIFAGIIEKLPDQNLGKTDIILKKVSCVDYSSLIDKQNIVDTFEDMYAKEILSRVVYFFTARDQEKILFDCESIGTAWGIATTGALSNESINGNYSWKIWATGSWVWYYEKTISPVDISSFEALRYWLKTASSDYISSYSVYIGNNSSNYIKFTKNEVLTGLWSYESFNITDGVITWTVDKTNITYIKFEFTALSSFSSWQILFDDLQISNGGFTLNNTQKWNIIFADVRANYKKPWEFINNLAKLENFFRYVDYERDLHYFTANKENAPFEITPTSNNYNNLTRTVDLSKLKNRQTIRGGQAPDDTRYIQTKVVDWVEESWGLDYPPKDLKVYVDTWSGFIQKTVWVENLTDSSTVDYIFNFSEKVVRRASAWILASWNKIKIDYLPYKDIRVRYQDKISIDKMKALTGGSWIYDGAVITDESIKTFEDARIRAKAEIEAYKNPLVTIQFETQQENLKAWQLVHIVDPARDLDDYFTIQKIKIKSLDLDSFVYTVTAASTLFWYIEFFQLLFKKTEKGQVGVNELVDIMLNLDEVLSFTDNFVFYHKTPPFYAMGPTPGETPNDAYADFSETI